MKAIRVEEQGGPEVMVYRDFELPPPAPGQVQVKLEAIGVNFRDIYQRSGEYPMKLPYTPGTEGAGTITALGDGVAGLQRQGPSGLLRGSRGLRRDDQRPRPTRHQPPRRLLLRSALLR